jgi:hypothetical protein
MSIALHCHGNQDATDAATCPKPCERFKKMPSSKAFFAHLPYCDACKAVISYLKRDLEIKRYLHLHRN